MEKDIIRFLFLFNISSLNFHGIMEKRRAKEVEEKNEMLFSTL